MGYGRGPREFQKQRLSPLAATVLPAGLWAPLGLSAMEQRKEDLGVCAPILHMRNWEGHPPVPISSTNTKQQSSSTPDKLPPMASPEQGADGGLSKPRRSYGCVTGWALAAVRKDSVPGTLGQESLGKLFPSAW